jgi:hypothetical protein
MMADPVSRIINLPLWRRRILALAVLILVSGGFALLSWSALAALGNSISAVEEKRLMLGRLQAMAALKPSLERDRLAIAADDTAGFLDGETEAVVRGNMQTRLTAIASTTSATLLSIGNISPYEVDGVRYIGMRVDLSGPVEAIHGMIFEIEAGRPAFIIRQASIWTGGGQQATSSPPEISAQLQVYAPLRPDVEVQEAAPSQ